MNAKTTLMPFLLTAAILATLACSTNTNLHPVIPDEVYRKVETGQPVIIHDTGRRGRAQEVAVSMLQFSYQLTDTEFDDYGRGYYI